ncbi:hypothetical protein FEM48_Zijuj07G0012500 [Ziziphus jujuba var. spinosa]|uniref:Uncharacterized protein n=1 Tax=Ziziphus jujuba var. spinosa TaxID=714518 RepID=A0A978V1L1_ZIZJJ|nr:hypothetical protein FEM48_Zijuj07G0012500 [Ziziphus jujuba var. spinosa]
MSGGGKVVFVTGASGFIASWLVKASVRAPCLNLAVCEKLKVGQVSLCNVYGMSCMMLLLAPYFAKLVCTFKNLAEDAAWKFAKENEIDLVTIHPGFTIASQILENVVYRSVDVRDVACAHIQASELASASGSIFQWEDEKPPMPIHHVSNEKEKGLGVDFIYLEMSLRDTVECFKEKGLLIMLSNIDIDSWSTHEDLTVGLECHAVECRPHTST